MKKTAVSRGEVKGQKAKGRRQDGTGEAGRKKAGAGELLGPASSVKRDASRLPIVGIGASAGGLEALELFLKSVPRDSGLAFVVVQHLDPTHKGMLVELLRRATTMPVTEIADRTRVRPNRVYVIPPNRDLSILHGVLHLIEPAAPRGLRLPVDYLFRSIADDQQEQSIGVILSGMGSDGTLGLRAIKEKGGAVFVQSPESAKFDGMPRSAIDAGLADVVAPVEELPGRIVAFLHRVPGIGRPDKALADKEQSALEKVLILLRTQTGHDFSLYKRSGVYRRIERRMGLHQLATIADYVRYLSANAQEADLLFNELLIGVTSFFRDPDVWEQLKTDVLPGLLAARPKGGLLRAWVAGCSTGEEAYSLAIVFREALEQLKPDRGVTLQVFATDLDQHAIEAARAGSYPANIAADVSEERLHRFFVQKERGYRVSKEVREMVIFARHSLIVDPPFTKVDILTCRNLLIYLAPELQRKLLSLFHYGLNPGGVLLLGSAETVGAATHLFTPLAGKSRLYRRADGPAGPEQPEFPPVFTRARPVAPDEAAVSSESSPPVRSLQALAENLLLGSYTPAAVLVTRSGDIVYVGGRTGKYLEPASGKANWNLFAMVRKGLDSVVHTAFRKALAQEARVTLPGVPVKTDGGIQTVNLTIEPITEPAGLRGMVLVVFADVAAPAEKKASGRLAKTPVLDVRQTALEEELQRARDEVDVTREEMQTSQEELKSTNEELQSANEELQSTNEELTTSKEEMQSMNEELQTLNQELQGKVDELMRASDDMRNLLNSTNIATLFLDDALNVRRFTTQAAGIFKLLPGDIGRPITDLASDLDYPGLVDDVRTVLRTLVFQEKSVGTRDGRWFTVRIMPYRTQDDRIDGVVITLSDITVAKRLEAELRARGDTAAGVTSR